MKIACTGSRGMVGRALVGKGVLPFHADILDPTDIDRELNRVKPDVILHLAAKSNVDWCEKPENKESVINTNLHGTYHVAEIAEKYNIPVVLLSSDHVFSGKKLWGKYKEEDIPSPVDFYGHSKMSAEALTVVFSNLKVVRTTYLFDYSRLQEPLEAIRNDKEVLYPTFINRSFLFLPHFVGLFVLYCKWISEVPTILHLAGMETVSWYKFMRDVAKGVGLDWSYVLPRRYELSGLADRGHNLGLDISLSRKLGFPQYSYQEGIDNLVNYA